MPVGSRSRPARDALDRLGEVNARRSEAGASEIRCGIALHAGDVMYGNVGSARRLDFTATGPATNEVCRLEALCKTLAVPLVISEVAASLHGGNSGRSVAMSSRVSVVRSRSFRFRRS
jgi:adenylate cyclase